MSKAMKKDVKEVFKWTEVLRKNLVETCLEAQARGNFTDSGFKSAEWSKIEKKFNSISGEMKAYRQQLQNQLAELNGNSIIMLLHEGTLTASLSTAGTFVILLLSRVCKHYFFDHTIPMSIAQAKRQTFR